MSPSPSLGVALLCALAGGAIAAPSRPKPTYVHVDAPPQARDENGTANASSQIVYLRRCPLISGCTLNLGNDDDARTDTTSIGEGTSGTRIIGEFSQGNEVWNDLVACVKKTFEAFDITITDVDPATSRTS